MVISAVAGQPIRAVVARDVVVVASAFDALDVGVNVVALAGVGVVVEHAVVGIPVKRDHQFLGRGGIVGGVFTRSAEQRVLPAAAKENVVAGVAVDQVVAAPGGGGVISVTTVDDHRLLDGRISAERIRLERIISAEEVDQNVANRAVLKRKLVRANIH